MTAKYLRITIHDNDFTSSLEEVGILLYKMFNQYEYPTEDQLPMISECIKQLWYSITSLDTFLHRGHLTNVDISYFTPILEFIDYLDIPDWDNYESIYIPMFDNADIIVR